MTAGFRIGRLFGITIRVDWTWMFIFAWVTFNLAGALFTQVRPPWGPAAIWGLAILASLLFFASVLAHELAHSLVARARGLPVSDITLFIFGGVSNLQREPTSPGMEFVVAVVGPVTSLVLGVIFLLIGLGTSAGGAAIGGLGGIVVPRDPFSAILEWLGSVNLMLGIFNLIPGFPLDGGRVLRSILWAATGSLRRATRWASWVGQAIGWLLIAAGLATLFGFAVPILGAGAFQGLWAIFIGWFLNGAALQSYRQVVIHDVLRGVPVARLMRPPSPPVPPTLPVGDLVHDRILGTDERAFPVAEDGHLSGLICLDDVRKAPREDWDTTPVSRLMTPADRLATVGPEEDAGQAFDELARRDVNQLPVVSGGRLVGMLTRQDLLRWLQIHANGATEGGRA